MFASLLFVLPLLAGVDAAPPASRLLRRENGVGPGLTQANIDRILELHNNARARYGTPPVTWNAELAADAQSYVDTCYSKDWKKTTSIPYNPNLAAYVGFPLQPPETAIDFGVNFWISEEQNYDWSKPGIDPKYPKISHHFTELVWKEVKQIGCGLNLGCQKDQPNLYQMICFYTPPGNFYWNESEQSAWTRNVPPPKDQSQQTGGESQGGSQKSDTQSDDNTDDNTDDTTDDNTDDNADDNTDDNTDDKTDGQSGGQSSGESQQSGDSGGDETQPSGGTGQDNGDFPIAAE